MRRRTLRRATLLAVVMLVLPATGPEAGAAEVTEMERSAATVRPAVFYLETWWTAKVQDHDGDWFGPYEWGSSCSGFGVNPDGYIATAGHCVDNQPNGLAWRTAIDAAVQEWIDYGFAAEEDRASLTEYGMMTWKVEGIMSGTPIDAQVYVQQGVAVSGERTGRSWPARVMSMTPLEHGDVALLKVEQTNLPSLLVAGEEMRVGTDVLSIGYPGSVDMVADATYEPAFKDGKVSGVRTTGGGLYKVYELSSAMSGGMSGGPTVNRADEVIGVNSFSIFGEPQAFNFVSASSLITEMLARNGVENRLGRTDEAYRAGLEAFYAGNRAEALERFDAVLDITPSHQQAQEFRARAVDLPEAEVAEAGEAPAAAVEQPADEEGGGGGSSLPLLLGIAAAVLLLGGGGFLLLRRRRGSPAPVPPEAATSTTATATGAAAGDGVLPSIATMTMPVAAEPGFCGHCGHALASGERFCSSCGVAVHPEVHEVIERHHEV